MRLLLCFLLCLISSSLVAVQAKGLKILGGFVKEYSANSQQYYGTYFEWGQSKVDGNSEAELIGHMFCWTRNRQNFGMCYHYLVISTKDDPTEEHYQLIGSYQRIYDHDVVLETNYQNGMTEEKPPYQKIHVANGETWCRETKSFRYGDLFFFVNKTTQPSITDDISYIVVKRDNHVRHKEEQFLDYHDSTSVRVQLHGVSTWSSQWERNTYMKIYVWRAPTTLVEVKPLKDKANLISHDYNVKKSVALSNKGSRETSSNFPILGTTQTFTTTSQSRFLSSWDFSFSLEQTISFQIYAVGSETKMTAGFSYHNEKEMTQTNSVTTTVTMKWPSECRSGFRVTYTVAEIIEEQELPIELYFKRAGVVWTEIDKIKVVLKKLDLTKDDCCLFDWADESCGSESLNMCLG